MEGKIYPKIQIVDENDNLIGNVDYYEALRLNAIRRAARVFVLNESGGVLIQQRSEHINHPLLFDHSVGGHVDEGETYLEAAVRETEEELGLTGVTLELIEESYRTQNFFSNIYKTIVPDDIEINFDPHEVKSVNWMTVDEVTSLITATPELCTGSLPVIWLDIKSKLLQ